MSNKITNNKWTNIIALISAIALTAAIITLFFIIPHFRNNNVIEINSDATIYWTDQAITCELKENPTTGYRWEFETQYKIIDDNFIHKKDGMVGSPGTRKITLEVKQPGEIKCFYKRSWEENNNPPKYIFKVDYKDNKITTINY